MRAPKSGGDGGWKKGGNFLQEVERVCIGLVDKADQDFSMPKIGIKNLYVLCFIFSK